MGGSKRERVEDVSIKREVEKEEIEREKNESKDRNKVSSFIEHVTSRCGHLWLSITSYPLNL